MINHTINSAVFEIDQKLVWKILYYHPWIKKSRIHEFAIKQDIVRQLYFRTHMIWNIILDK